MSSTTTTQVEKEVLSLINTLGFLEKGTYYLEPDCFQNLRDLIRHLHRDDRRHTVRRLCMGHNIVKNDLVPILRLPNVDEALFDAALRICVNLCQPILLVFEGAYPDDADGWQTFYELEASLIRSLLPFADPAIFHTFCAHIKAYFEKDWEERTEKERLLAERIFVLIRYIFAIGVEGAKYLSVPEVDHRVRERVAANLFSSGLDTVFLKLAGNSTEREFCCYIVAVLALIFKTMNPLAIAQEGAREQLEQQQLAKFEREEAIKVELAKQEETRKRASNRRSFLAGTYVVKGLKALNTDNDFVMRRALAHTENNSNTDACSTSFADSAHALAPLDVLAQRKRPKVVPRNRRVQDLDAATDGGALFENDCMGGSLHWLDAAAAERVRDFCWRLLTEGRYNKLMRITKDIAFLSAGRQQQRQQAKLNELHFLTLSTFMLAFARHAHASSQSVACTFSVEFFHQLTAFLTNCFDLMKTDRGAVRKYALSAQHAISTFKEMMIMLNSISNSQFPADKDYFTDFCTQIFKMEEYRELAIGILVHLSPGGATHRMLQDLIVANHYFLHVMEKMVRRGELFRVQKRKRQRKRRKAQAKRRKDQEKSLEKALTLEGLHELWTELAEEVSDTLVGELEPNEHASPINMLIRADDDQQQAFALLNVQTALRSRRVADAVGIYRNARMLWPETGTFGDDALLAEDEFVALQQIFQADMRHVADAYTEELRKAYGEGRREEGVDDDEEQDEEGKEDEEEEDEEGGGGEEEFGEDEAKSSRVYSEFDFPGFISASASPAVINWYVFCLRKFRTNTQEVNLAILKFFHRIAFELKSPARLYLATLFKILLEVGREVNSSSLGGGDSETTGGRSRHPHFRLMEFGHHLLRKFFAHFKQRASAHDGGGGVLVCELLFTKSAREAYEIEHGYGSL